MQYNAEGLGVKPDLERKILQRLQEQITEPLSANYNTSWPPVFPVYLHGYIHIYKITADSLKALGLLC